jgi:anti-sigma regulatory factor (Ser/Thr protein kinase)
MNGTRVHVAPVHARGAAGAGDGPPWVDLAATSAAAGRARAWTRAVLAEWNLRRLAEDAELVVSELVTNAVQAGSQAGTSDPVRVCMAAIGTQLLIQVRDSCPGFPVRRNSGAGDEAGRGLMIVDQVAAEVGWYRVPASRGKVVWCLLTVDPAPGKQMGAW